MREMMLDGGAMFFHQTSKKTLLLCQFPNDRRDCRFSEYLKRFDPALATNQVVLPSIFRGHRSSIHAGIGFLRPTVPDKLATIPSKVTWFRDLGFQNRDLGNRYERYRVTRHAASIWARDAIPVKKFKSSNRYTSTGKLVLF